MVQLEPPRVQHHAAVTLPLPRAVAVLAIARDRAAERCEVDPDLVAAAGLQPTAHQAAAAAARQFDESLSAVDDNLRLGAGPEVVKVVKVVSRVKKFFVIKFSKSI